MFDLYLYNYAKSSKKPSKSVYSYTGVCNVLDRLRCNLEPIFQSHWGLGIIFCNFLTRWIFYSGKVDPLTCGLPNFASSLLYTTDTVAFQRVAPVSSCLLISSCYIFQCSFEFLFRFELKQERYSLG